VSGSESIQAVETSLRRRFRVVDTTVSIAGRTLEILHPASAEELIDEIDFERDERLPYWAELWPSSRILAEYVGRMTGSGRSLLELGCGAGLVTTSASLAEFSVVASDYYEDACRFARVNAARNGAPETQGLLLDWRALPADLPRFDVVLASDVLYERPYGALVAGAIAAALAPDGVALLADPGRVGRDEFLAQLGGAGLVLRQRTERPFVDGKVHQTITIFEIVRSDAVSS
jgi:predicted nicotinamide N-methyase